MQYIWCRHWQKGSGGKCDQIVIHVHFLGLPTSRSDGAVTHVDLVRLGASSHRSTGLAAHIRTHVRMYVQSPLRTTSSGNAIPATSSRLHIHSSAKARLFSVGIHHPWRPDNCIEPRSIVSRFLTESSKNRAYTRPCTVPTLSVVSSLTFSLVASRYIPFSRHGTSRRGNCRLCARLHGVKPHGAIRGTGPTCDWI